MTSCRERSKGFSRIDAIGKSPDGLESGSNFHRTRASCQLGSQLGGLIEKLFGEGMGGDTENRIVDTRHKGKMSLIVGPEREVGELEENEEQIDRGHEDHEQVPGQTWVPIALKEFFELEHFASPPRGRRLDSNAISKRNPPRV